MGLPSHDQFYGAETDRPMPEPAQMPEDVGLAQEAEGRLTYTRERIQLLEIELQMRRRIERACIAQLEILQTPEQEQELPTGRPGTY